jgi:DNA adenine methylase
MKLRNPSPLRYPGGKASLAVVLEAIIYANGLQGCTYTEPFAGGAGAAVKLLSEGHVDRIIINDADRAVFCFWRSVMRETEALIDRILNTPLSMAEWLKQKEIYQGTKRAKCLDLGFAAFYLNRCNRSGIIKGAGPIGGVAQEGKWKLDARFNRVVLATKVQEIAEFGDRVSVLQKDARLLIEGIDTYLRGDAAFIYADPPYYVKGRHLYLNFYDEADHAALAKTIQRQRDAAWVMTYDDVPQIRALYDGAEILPFRLRYSAHPESTQGGELLISPQEILIPKSVKESLSREAGFFRAA